MEPAQTTAKKSPEAVDRAARFLIRLAQELHQYGMPAHRLELALHQLSRDLGVEGQYMVAPTMIIASIGPPEAALPFLVRCAPGRINLGKQTELHRLICDVSAKRLTLEEARESLDALDSRPRRRDRIVAIAGFGLAAAATSVFLDGGRTELAAAGTIGLVIGALVQAAAVSNRMAMVLPGAAGLAAVLVGSAVQGLLGPIYPFIPTLAGLIILIPSLNLTIAVNELAHGHLMSGTSRLGGAFISFLQIAFGVALGNKIVGWFGPAATEQPESLPLVVLVPALIVAAIASTVLFRARTRDLPAILTTVSISFIASRLGTFALGPEVGVLLAAWLMGTAGHLLGRWRNTPSAVAILPGILPLLPGGLGFRSFSSLLSNDVVSGIEVGVTMLFVVLSLVTGLLLSSLTGRARTAF